MFATPRVVAPYRTANPDLETHYHQPNTTLGALAFTMQDQTFRSMSPQAIRQRQSIPPTATYTGGNVTMGDRTPVESPRFRAWGAGFGSTGRFAATPKGYGFDIGSAGGIVGVDWYVSDQAAVSATLSHGRAEASLSGIAGKNRSDVTQLAVAAVARIEDWVLNAALSHAWIDSRLSRTPALGAGLPTQQTLDANAIGARFEISRAVWSNGWASFSPVVAVQGSSTSSPLAVQTGAIGPFGFGLVTSAATNAILRGEAGAVAEATVPTGAGNVQFYGKVAYLNYLMRESVQGGSFTGIAIGPFAQQGATYSRHGVQLTAAAYLRPVSGLELGVRGDAELASGISQYSGSLSVKYAF